MRDGTLVEVLVELAETFTGDFDVIDFLHGLCGRCVDLLSVDAAGVLLAHPGGGLQVVAGADEQPSMVELFQVQIEEGPALDAWRSGAPVSMPELVGAAGRWPRFAPQAFSTGFAAAHAIPMRLRDESIGVLSLLGKAPGELDADSLRAAKAMVDVATIGLLQARLVRRHEVLIEQLQSALTSRVAIEQAKGFVAERLGLEMADAFSVLRAYARSNKRRLTEVATAVVDRAADVQDLFSRTP